MGTQEKSAYEVLYDGIKDTIRGKLTELKGSRARQVELESENRELESRIKQLKSETEGIDAVIATVSLEINMTNNRAAGYNGSIESLSSRREDLITDVNRLRVNIKTIMVDMDNCMMLKTHLVDEVEAIRSERDTVVKKLRDIENGVQQLSQKNESVLPHLQGYHKVLRHLYTVCKETENKMDVAIKLLT
ncbi:magnetosome protein Mad26 [Candidatus Magnetobacterium bavaricum]|uniref:Magnetosome protein Mad26 n=1 Tax=Candidatus Magnetobacterium bavaricum TaxID=29290 RepID=A0A0F3GW06_9BACT|nr:magnetosome protein Mad26 [Candidatus Magnetobacterium bavaricum]